LSRRGIEVLERRSDLPRSNAARLKPKLAQFGRVELSVRSAHHEREEALRRPERAFLTEIIQARSDALGQPSVLSSCGYQAFQGHGSPAPLAIGLAQGFGSIFAIALVVVV